MPAGDDWLAGEERQTHETLRFEPRRRDWRLGRWTAKVAVGTWLGVAAERVQILAAADGAPEAYLDGHATGLSVSLSHRAGRSLAAVAAAPIVVGCDLELVEPRSAAFVREWLTPGEQALLASCAEGEHARFANLAWAAKEAAAKVRRSGMRLDLRHAAVTPALDEPREGGWRALLVRWEEGAGATAGWWREDSGFMMAIAGEPAPEPPCQLDNGSSPDRESAAGS
ncbi:MAG TPA: 4'-phosphopantetheinyl transferase superfamily protein [Solirubrobacteraceae bacterium]|nr:4'-phosphopantetheinyl transferase superfamily protein [Solirubrobacteraceae bacterium]